MSTQSEIPSVNYNELAWTIDVIVEINKHVNRVNSVIKRSGGQNTLRGDANRYFPDVILFGGESSSNILQGWELKMPDTPVNNGEFIRNAEMKANLLNLDSFLLWNVKEAVLYQRQDGGFIPIESWFTDKISTRNEAEEKKDVWKALLGEIISYLEGFLASYSYRPATLSDVSKGLYSQSLERFTPVLSEYYKSLSVENFDFYVELSDWRDQNPNAIPYSKFKNLAEFVILAWLNRFIFAHYLKTFSTDATKVEYLLPNASLEQVLTTFQEISAKCDFMNIFIGSFGDQYIPDSFLAYLLQINELFKNIRLQDIEIDILQDVVENSFSESSKKIAGQFATPPNLARYAAEITIKDRTAAFLDPCCGSGTIPKAVYLIKRSSGIAPATALSQIWASDKFAHPLQLCSIALSNPEALGNLVQVFKKDVFEMHTGEIVTFVDPFIGGKVDKDIPVFQSIVSNLPFVQSNILEKKYRLDTLANAVGEPPLHGKSDLFAYIVFHLLQLVPVGGRIGIITSNSWLSTDWGNTFKQKLLENHKILRVVCSASGRWFTDADVVGLITVIEKGVPTDDHRIEFVSLSTDIHSWESTDLQNSVIGTLSKSSSDKVVKYAYTTKEIEYYQEMGMSWAGLFTNLSWLKDVESKLILAAELIDIDRGMRRGWDDMFYPEPGHNIEEKYIRPVVKNSQSFGSRLTNPITQDAFCCSAEISELQRLGHDGALKWIRKFEVMKNNKGKPLPEALRRTSWKWYEMPATSLADLVISMNPDRKMGVFLLPERSFVNQRLICLRCNDSVDKYLLHAVMNSVLGLFYIEAIGFGRGLGALDLSATAIRNKLRVLDIHLLNDVQADLILNKFEPILRREIQDLPNELARDDRMCFDRAVFEAFGIQFDIGVVYSALLRLYAIRKSVG